MKLPCEIQCMIFNETSKDLVTQIERIFDELKSNGISIPDHVWYGITLSQFDMSNIMIFECADSMTKELVPKILCKSGWSLN